MRIEQILPGIFHIHDICNVYLIRKGDEAIVIDFGSGKWMGHPSLPGINKISHVLLTHHHADQCEGLLQKKAWPFAIHAPEGEEVFLTPAAVRDFHQRTREPWPASYSVLKRGIPGIQYDLRAWGDFFWHGERIRFISTPGHGRNALTIVITHEGKQLLFCGDAAHAGATIRQPYHLEWDHWTGTGALAAWEGVTRIANVGIDFLCPSHGPVISKNPRAMLRKLAAKLLSFYHSKGQIAKGERDTHCPQERLSSGAWRVLPHLFQFGENGYLLLSQTGEAMLIDAPQGGKRETDRLLREVGNPRVTIGTATHYHSDHSAGLPGLKRHHGAKIIMHPWIAKPLYEGKRQRFPWFPVNRVRADALWPEDGTWQWHEYTFSIAPFPGQTWWHCAFQTIVDGKRVFFGGDSFQPPSRWNGTGGFSSLNGSRFEGFLHSAKLVMRWQPDILAAGHGTYYRYRKSHFQKIAAWARRAESATRALCPTGNPDEDYHLHAGSRI